VFLVVGCCSDCPVFLDFNSACGLDVVQRPVVGETADLGLAFQCGLQIGLGIFLCVFDDAGIRAAEVDLEPAVNGRRFDSPVFDRDAARVIDESFGPRIELVLKCCPGKCAGLQVGSAVRRAIDGIMNARVLQDGAHDVMLDIVKAKFLAADADNRRLPGAARAD